MTHLVTAAGTVVAEYGYDAWGKVTAATGSMAEVNPIRYRRYYYDAESEFYYLQSRYHDPAVCRFINADAYSSTGQDFLGYNMFAYCNNSPVIYSDSCGNWPEMSTIFAVIGAAALTAAAAMVTIAACAVLAPAIITVGGVAVATATVATAAVAVATDVLTVAAVATGAALISKKMENATKSYTVYCLKDPVTDEVTYVGRTYNYSQRMAAHALNPARDNLVPCILEDDLSYLQARAAEQAYIVHYATKNPGNPASNQINGVNPNRSDYHDIMKAGRGVSMALDSILTNLFLDFIE